jgi:hypothetical protein
MRIRDQHLQKIGILLFFPGEPPFSSAPSLKRLEIKMEEARSAYQKTIKLSVCFAKLLLF